MFIRRRGGQPGRGQALAEFALVIPVFMLVLGGVIQFGIWFWDQNTLNQIVRDAGRYAATVPNCSTASHDLIVTQTRQLENQTPFAGDYGPLSNITVTLPDPSPSPACTATDGPSSNKDVVWVTISVKATVPVFFPFVGGGISSTATYRMEPTAK